MLSSVFLLHLRNKETYEKSCICNCGDDTAPSYNKNVRKEVIVFVLLVLLDLSLFVFALYCLAQLQLQWYATLFLISGMFLPGIGFVIQFSVISFYMFRRRSLPSKVPG